MLLLYPSSKVLAYILSGPVATKRPSEHIRPAGIPIGLCIHTVWQEFLMRVVAGRTCPNVRFLAQMDTFQYRVLEIRV